MSRDLTAEEKQKFIELYSVEAICERCGDTDVTVKIWEKYGSDSSKIGGNIGPEGIVGAVIACNKCGHGQTLTRSRILEAG